MTPDQIETIKRLAAEGRAAREIGAAIGCLRTSVIGYCWRNGIVLRQRVARRNQLHPVSPHKPKPVAPAPPVLQKAKPKFRITGIGSMPSCIRPRADGPGADLLEVGAGQCRYVIGDARAQRCCGMAAAGSWCRDHALLVFDRSVSRT